MKKIITVIIALLVLSFAIPVFASGIPEAVLEKATSVLNVETSDAEYYYSGTAFVISNDGEGTYLLTNHHVISPNPDNAYVYIGEGTTTTVKVIAADEKYDLALLKTSQPLSAEALKFATSAERGDAVYAIGFPGSADALSDKPAHLSDESTVTDGVISAIRDMTIVKGGPQLTFLQTTATINQGNSGGPLLDSDGLVAGVNTYGVEDAQGTFGALSVSAVSEFLTAYGYADLMNSSIAETAGFSLFNGIALWAVFLIGITLLFVIAFVIVWFTVIKKKSSKETRKVTKAKDLSLAEYIAAIDKPLSNEDAVTLLMPVALELRDKHNAGMLFLKLNSQSVRINKNGCYIKSDYKDNGYTDFIFTAPEQKNGGQVGTYTDVYSFCMLLKILTGEELTKENNFSEILAKGISENKEERYSGMQELILCLAAFNKGTLSEDALRIFTGKKAPSKITEEQKQKPKDKRKLAVILAFAGAYVAVLAAGFFIYNAVNMSQMEKYANNHEYENLLKAYGNSITENEEINLYHQYGVAGYYLNNGEYEKAASAFEKLGSYKDSYELANNSKYLYGCLLLDRQEYSAALNVFESLGNNSDFEDMIKEVKFRKVYDLIDDYRFSEALIGLIKLEKEGFDTTNDLRSLRYSWGEYLFKEEDYASAYDNYQLAEGYGDSDSAMNKCLDELYNLGVYYYHQNDISTAINIFKDIIYRNKFYLRAADYYVLCDASEQILKSEKSYPELDDELYALIGFENAEELYRDYLKLGNWWE